MKSELKRNIVLALGLAALIGGGLAALEYHRSWRDAASTLRTDSYAVTDHVELLIRNLRLEAETVADGLDPEALATSGRPILEKVWRENSGLKGVLVVDATGRVVDEAHTGGSTKGLDMSARAYFRAHRDGVVRGAFLSAPIRSRVDGSWVLPLSVPIKKQDGAFAGVVVVGAEPGYFSHLSHTLTAIDSRFFLRVRSNGAVLPLADTPDMPDLSDTIAAHFEAAAADNVTRHVDKTDWQLPNAIAAIRPSPSDRFDVVVVRTHTALEQAARSAAARLGAPAFALSTAIFMTLVGLWWWSLKARLANVQMTKMAENTPGAIFEWIMQPDHTVSFAFFSASLPDLLGVTQEALEANGTAVFTHIPQEDIQATKVAIVKAAEGMTHFEFRHRVNHPERGLRWVLVSANPTPRKDGSISWYGNTVDITDQMEAEKRAAAAAEELRAAHGRLTSVAEIAPVGLYEYLWHGPGQIEFTYTSAHFETLMGYTREEILDLQAGIFERIHPDDLQGYVEGIAESSITMTPRHKRVRIIHPTRGLRWLSAAATPRKRQDGTVIWTGALSDVTADVEREEELRKAHRLAEEMRAENEHRALHDGLTGLPNRRYYDRMLAAHLARARQGEQSDCTLIRLDLDHFKYVNDTLGHAAGDAVLERVAEVLRAELRASDFAARIGGDEFSILLAPGTSEATANALVARIREGLAEPLMHEGRQCRFGASFGIVQTDDLATMDDDIQIFADAALYRAKDGGRNRVEVFTTEIHREIQHDRRFAFEIHEGLDAGQFVPFFQPQVSAEDGSLVGIETLLRWQHPADGLLAPDRFMHVAEQLRLVPEIDRVMMEKSRDALIRWQAEGLTVPKISFNVSSGRMHDPDVVALAREMAMGETRVAFELLESILVEEESDAFRFHLDRLRDAGVEIEIDDFGSGHASIVSLMEIAPSALKIDKRIVLPVADDMRARNLVRAIVEIAETLGINTVAEGVETEDQAAILRGIGCNVLQGYLFARPLSEDNLLQFALGARQERA
ncbi:EAL domain-containing protein [Rhodovulum sp. P5]|uniref:EAL domain-containing protein n=1 Tax=Rhodovulum sp. P5 TaxID=1564506 RepID=UPI0009DACD33|nr:EAL domain-containing protein [Rhodovulum sp. P5]